MVPTEPPRAKIISPGELEASQPARSEQDSLPVRAKFIGFGWKCWISSEAKELPRHGNV